jgi:hypothetical protein
MTPVARPLRLQRRLLATALASGLCCIGSPLARAVDVTAPPQLRSDPARRIFPALPATRAPLRDPASPAVTLVVTNCADDGPGSLRAAIGHAADDDVIDLTQLTCSTITLTTGAIEIDLDTLTINGPGRSALAIDGGGADRVLIHPGGGGLMLQGLSVRGGGNHETGFDVAGGGCIASAGYLTLVDTSVFNCYASGEGAYGGAIYAYSLTLHNSTLSGNTALGTHPDAGTAAFGGAAFVYALEFADSTISGNRAIHQVHAGRESYDIGGGVVSVTGGSIRNSTIDSNASEGRAGGLATFNPLAVSNSTFSHNVAQDGRGGGLFLRWPSTLEASNSTFSANSATEGGGIWLGAATSDLRSCILYGNSAQPGQFADLQDNVALVLSGNNNLVGESGGNITLPPDTRHDNPLLGPLSSNGGPTRTHALLRGSPAVDAGSNDNALAFDQRGTAFPRIFGTAPDIGSFEQQGVPVDPVAVPAMSAWITCVLAALFGLIGLARVPRRRRVASIS